MLQSIRTAIARKVARRALAGIGILGLATGGTVAAGVVGSAVAAQPAGAVSSINSHWTWCNDNASHAPSVVFWRIAGATHTHPDIPSSFYSNTGYRNDIAKIVCYESTYYWHATNGPQYGWFQMGQSLIGSEGVQWSHYWNGSSTHAAGWYQAVAGERYIHNRYGNPYNAWEHERNYGWY